MCSFWCNYTFFLDSCPGGWILADGSSGSPDLRGVFVRGIDVGSTGKDPSGQRNKGNYQDDAFERHTHNIQDGDASAGGEGLFVDNVQNAGSGPDAITRATGGDETRPKNVALLYCMKE